MAAEREELRRSLRAQGSNGSDPDPPWWKEVRGTRTKRVWVLVGVFVLAVVILEQDEPWKALGAAVAVIASSLFSGWRRKGQEQEAEEAFKPILNLRDSDRDERGARR